jgi:nucleoside-diphosphate-sugar epimerase
VKHILITGTNSYIGTSFANYLKQWPDLYHYDTLDMVDVRWREKNFSAYDIIVHVAGIAHNNVNRRNSILYYKVNRDLTIETARKAKIEGVSQFIFLSTMSVYSKTIGEITPEDIPYPKSHYGISKLQAENALTEMEDIHFKVTILRPPMVYGKGCKGNFNSLIFAARILPIFPMFDNQRSMIYIDHLSCFIALVINKKLSGIYFPQNREYSCTSHIIATLSTVMGKKIRLSRLLSPLAKLAVLTTSVGKKAFGTLIYKDTEVFSYEYCTHNIEWTIQNSVQRVNG